MIKMAIAKDFKDRFSQNTASPADKLIVVICLALCIFALFASAVGIVRSYTPVPFWDMWNGGVGFVIGVLNGDQSGWFAQHNEHRIVLARLLFLLDHTLFDSSGAFLFAMNFVFSFASGLVLTFAAVQLLKNSSVAVLAITITFSIVLSVSWLQSANLTWTFQSQFFLAQLLPLSGFICAAITSTKTVKPGSVDRSFVLACLFAILSLGTMANGIFALPLTLMLVAYLRKGTTKIAILFALNVICLSLFFVGYQSVSGHGSLLSIFQAPVPVLDFLLVYVGSPLGQAFNGAGVISSARWFGVLFLILSAWQFVLLILRDEGKAIRAALIAFLIFIGIGSGITSAGRHEFGVGYALESRYTTPMLLGWAALAILVVSSFDLRRRTTALFASFIGLAALAPFTLVQYSALENKDHFRFSRLVAALAIELNVNDEEVLQNIIPVDAAPIRQIADRAASLQMSVFSSPPIGGLQLSLGDQARQRGRAKDGTCEGHVDSVRVLPRETDFARIEGWYSGDVTSTTLGSLRLIDAEGAIVGYVIHGMPRADVFEARGGGNRNTGFVGYVSTSAMNGAISVGPSDGGCEIRSVMTTPPFSVRSTPSDENTIAIASGILSRHNFSNEVELPLSSHKLLSYGSNSGGDSDVGHLRIQLSKGQGIYYVSGPNVARQRLIVAGQDQFLDTLPQVINWTKPLSSQYVFLKFDDPTLPDVFEVEFVDKGEGWGEWSAVALRAAN